MRTRFLILTIAFALLAVACGDDGDTSVGDPSDTLPVDTVPSDTLPPETLPPETLPSDTVPSDTLPSDTPPSDTRPDDGPILGAGPYPIADLTISVTMTSDGETSTYRLACLGDTATLTGDPAPAGADAMCLALNDDALKDRLLLGDLSEACSLQYGGPEKATVTGTFDGDVVDTEFHRTDGCGIGDWGAMSGVLPSPS